MKFAKRGIDYHDVEAREVNPGNVRPLAEVFSNVPWG